MKTRQTYQTPPEFLDAVRRLIGIDRFDLDVCAEPHTAASGQYYTKEQDGLNPNNPWSRYGWNWCNPPFSNIKPWVKRAYEERGGTAMLVPASIDSAWWEQFVHNKADVIPLHGRVTFVGCAHPFPKPLVLLLYRSYAAPGYRAPWHWKTFLKGTYK